jgi:hypothetical protein
LVLLLDFALVLNLSFCIPSFSELCRLSEAMEGDPSAGYVAQQVLRPCPDEDVR